MGSRGVGWNMFARTEELLDLPRAPKQPTSVIMKKLGLNLIDHKNNLKSSKALNRMTTDMAIAAKFFGRGEINHASAYMLIAAGCADSCSEFPAADAADSIS